MNNTLDPQAQPDEKSSTPEIFANFLSFILLSIVATALGVLYFQVVNKYFPDLLAGLSSGRSIRFRTTAVHSSIAALIVGFPLYLWMLWFWFKSFRNKPAKQESLLTKWLTYVVLLIAAVLIVGDLITIIFKLLQGELGTRFFLKALTILVIAGFIFAFYFLERKRIQYKKEITRTPFQILGGISVVLVIAGIVLGFFAAGTPAEARLRKFDLERVQNLDQIISGVDRFTRDNRRLPESLDELKRDSRYRYHVSSTADPETGEEYEYTALSSSGTSGTSTSYADLEYELCAKFTLSTLGELDTGYYRSAYSPWAEHDKGRVCNTQTVTAQTTNKGENAPLAPQRTPALPLAE